MKFSGQILTFDTSSLGWNVYIKIPPSIFEAIHKVSKDKRVICTLNNDLSFHCAMLPKVTFYYIMLNTEICKKLNLHVNDEVEVQLAKDDSKYGMAISPEMEEVLFSDPEGNKLFHELTPGKIRSMIHVINKVKNSQIKIDKSFVILDHLKRRKGQLDFKILNEDFKAFNNKNKI